ERSNAVVWMLGARACTGFVRDASAPPPGFMPWPDAEPEIQRYLSLMVFLGVPPRGTGLEFPLTDGDRAEYAALAARHGLAAGGYVCVHPGARLPTRRWPPERFAAVADELA